MTSPNGRRWAPLALEEQVLVAEITVWRYTVAAVIDVG
ncbi:hypothetical protein RIB2604_00900610 [Aspergillus luchuensis]|uniref:Uncharacterized protein n=1 Tax=Aspergillus kawachii TaxID=1069201 RepID=A0A146F4E9_ASPKA|nr:hypothetical protein RIB2604_00900610 [Aspergillus luchuensis]